MKLAQMQTIAVDLEPPRLSDYGRELARHLRVRELADTLREQWPARLRSLEEAGAIVMASFSDYAENKILDHALGKTSWTMPATVALALCTVVPTDSSTGATITEASYTGYARKTIAGADWNAASGGSSTTANTLTFAACTSGSSTVIGFAICDSGTTGAGNVIAWGTCTSTVVSTTQTPASVNAGALGVTLD